MPLDEYLPQIDDRRYSDIMDEVRTRIARYTPEWKPVWTDLNDNDPGITMVQVFAWLAEMLMFRMARVPELNYLKFLQLLGIELRPAEPALAEITFPVKEKHSEPYIIIPLRTQVSGQAADGGAPVIFETERAIYALTARLQALVAFDGYAYTPVTSENESAQEGFQPFGPLAKTESSLLLGFGYGKDSALNYFPTVELDLAFWSKPEASAAHRVEQCGFAATPVYPPATLVWEYWNGKSWAGLDLLKDETLALTRSGHVRLRTPAKGLMQPAVMAGETTAYWWMRMRILESQYEKPPELLAVRTNTAAAVQAETIQDEVLGGSNGRRDQVFRLENAPVLAGTLKVEVDEGSGYQPWTEVGDFLGSGPEDMHYVLNRTTGEICFGDGEHGRIPVGNANNAANVIARQYRFGGGQRGNLAAGEIKSAVTSITGVDDGKVGNLMAAVAGRDEETLDDAKKRAPLAIKSRCRAVTGEDFEYLAMQAGNIRRAKALPLAHPAFLGVQVPGVITVIVVPDSLEPNPIPSEGTLRTVCAYLDQRRLLTTEVYVVPPSYQQVQIAAEVFVQDSADLAEVKTAIETSLLDYFHPLTGGEDGLGWPFGGAIFYSRVYQRVFSTPGVQSIQRLTIFLDGEEAQECRDVPLKTGALAYSTAHQVNVLYPDSQ